jgi:hypothetical protein
VPIETAEAIAVKEATLEWPGARLATTIPYYDFDGTVSAYACVFSLHAEPFPDYGSLLDAVKTGRALSRRAAALGDTALGHRGEDLSFGVNRYGTVVIAARTDQTPILETANCLPRFFTTLDRAQSRTRELLGGGARFTKIYYQAPEDEWFGFTNGQKEIFINAYSLKIYDRSHIVPQAARAIKDELAVRLNQSWDRLTRTNALFRTVSAHIDSVPYCLWSYGCSPTASAMILWYWDSRGYGRLVDYFFDRYDAVEKDQDNNMPNVQQQLAIGMTTDSMTGATFGKFRMATGHLYVANHLNGYSFSSHSSADGDGSNGWVWDFIKAEVDSGRPCNWSVFHYFPDNPDVGHSLCALGYEIDTAGDSFVTVHNTWDTGEHKWALWVMVGGSPSSDFAVNVVPGGANPNTISLTFPQTTATLISGLQYTLTWQTAGSTIDHIGLWYAKSAKKSEWKTLTDSFPNTGFYAWAVPNESTQARVNIVGYAGSEEIADDGSVKKFTVRNLPRSANLSLLGHVNTFALGTAGSPPYLFTTKATMGIEAIDISDPMLPKDCGGLILPGYTQNLVIKPPYLYAACQSGGLRIVDIHDIKKLSEIGNFSNQDRIDAVSVQDSLALLAGEQTGLTILDIRDPKNPKAIGFASTTPAYDVATDGNRTCYIAGPNNGVAVVNVTDPFHPVVAGQLKTDGLPTAIALLNGYLYAAMGTVGVEIIELTNPAHKTVLKTKGIAGDIALADHFLYVVNGVGGTQVFDISDPMAPKEAGSVKSLSNSSGISACDQYFYIADGNAGVYILKNLGAAVAEGKKPIHESLLLSAPTPNPFNHKTVLKFYLPRNCPVALSIYNPLGRLVATVVSATMAAGIHTVVWDGREADGRTVAPGVYFYRFRTDNFTSTGKIILVR